MKRIPLWLALALAFGAGCLMATQSRINGELGHRMNDGFAAATISFGSGLVILLVALAFSRSARAGVRRVTAALRTGELKWWMVLGGAAGAFMVLSQGLTTAILGVSLFTVAAVAGQTIGSAVIDRTSLVPGGRRRLTPTRISGTVLAIAAVVVAQSSGVRSGVPLWLMILPLIAGLAIGWQAAVNGRIRETSASVMTATLANFAVGTAVLTISAVVNGLLTGFPTVLPHEPWLYVGGMIGVICIALAAFLVHITGTLVYFLATIAGQLVTAVVLDLVVPGATPIGMATIAGVVLALVAVVVGSLQRMPRFARRRHGT